MTRDVYPFNDDIQPHVYYDSAGGGSLPAVLQEANTVVLSNSDCEGFWGSNVNDGHVCIRNYDENKGSCNVSYLASNSVLNTYMHTEV